ncbi:MAG: cell division protein FtsQ [Candidatus Niyogibacteria bacterium]|nr:cell division protein FtsQ [Candidatus Niyogibacteria bacterium]
MQRSTLERTRRVRRRRHLIVGLGVVAGAFVGIGAAGLAADRWLAVREFDVRGASAVPAFEISRAAEESIAESMFFRRNLIGMSPAALRGALLARFPALGDVTIARELFSRRLIIAAKERGDWAHWCRINACFYVDENAVAFAPAPEISDEPILRVTDASTGAVALGSGIYDPAEIGRIRTFIHALEMLGEDVTQIAILDDGEWDLITNTNKTLILDSKTDPVVAGANFAALLSGPLKNKTADYIDLRFPEKAFYKLK